MKCTYLMTLTIASVLTIASPKADASDAGETLPKAPAGWTSLFNGKNLDGWTQRNGTASYKVEGDTIVGTTAEGSPNSFLCTNKEYGDFELTFEVKDEVSPGVFKTSDSFLCVIMPVRLS